MARVVISRNADADTDAYLARHSGRNVAIKHTRLFEALCERLANHPASGPARLALGPNIRIGIVSPYIIYQHSENDDTVTVLRIVHGRQEITRKLLSPRG